MGEGAPEHPGTALSFDFGAVFERVTTRAGGTLRFLRSEPAWSDGHIRRYCAKCWARPQWVGETLARPSKAVSSGEIWTRNDRLILYSPASMFCMGNPISKSPRISEEMQEMGGHGPR